MATRTPLIALTGAAVIAVAAGCGTSNTPTQTATSAPTSAAPASATASASPAQPPAQPSPVPTTSPTGLATGSTRVPCELLTPTIAKAFAGDDAERQLQLDSDPPLPVGDDACFYKGAAGSVMFTITPMPSDPDDPVNHFHVIRPENQIPGLAYKAYWFGAGESLVVVKDGLLLDFKVSGNPAGAETYQERRDHDIKLADQIVPRVG
jgi:hypothetical protein